MAISIITACGYYTMKPQAEWYKAPYFPVSGAAGEENGDQYNNRLWLLYRKNAVLGEQIVNGTQFVARKTAILSMIVPRSEGVIR